MSYPVAAKQLLRDTLLDAAHALLGEKPWTKISMGDVAARAGVSRQTLYNEFGGRREFAEAFVMREAERLLTGAEAEIARRTHDPRAAIAAAMETFLVAASHNRLLQAMTSEDDGGLLALVTTRGGVLAVASERLAAFLERTWPGVDPARARVATETIVRLAISHATLPTGPPARTARDLTRVLGPHIDELIPSASQRAA